MPRHYFKKGNTFGQAPAQNGSPSAKGAATCAPFTSEQDHYVKLLCSFEAFDHWFPYTSKELPPGCEHIATIWKVMMISRQRHQSIVQSHTRLSHGNQSIVRHLRDLGLPNISEENITQLSVGGQKMTWVNFHPQPTKCPKEVCQQKSTRVTFWSRKLSLSVGRFDGEEEEEEEETEEMVENEAEASMWSTAAGRSLGSAGNTTITCGDCAGSGDGVSVSSRGCCSSCCRGEETGVGLTPLVAGCLQLLGDMKSDAASLCEWLLFQKIEKATAILVGFKEFENMGGSSQVSFLLRSDKRGDLIRFWHPA